MCILFADTTGVRGKLEEDWHELLLLSYREITQFHIVVVYFDDNMTQIQYSRIKQVVFATFCESKMSYIEQEIVTRFNTITHNKL